MLGKSAYAETGTAQETAANTSHSLGRVKGGLPSSAQSTHCSEFHKFSCRQRIIR